MAAYVIVEVDIHDQELYEEYKKLTPEAVSTYEGKFIVRGGATTTLEGDWNPARIVVLEFPSVEKAQAWWDSDLYSAAKENSSTSGFDQNDNCAGNLIFIKHFHYNSLKYMKDNFSSESDKYAKFRPLYPEEMFTFIYSKVADRGRAWDCGTGNGQVAERLAENFAEVFGTDISESQLKNAFRAKNIHYSLQAAEKVAFPSDFFDLIIVAQAIHWFDFERFYAEVNRTGKSGGILAVVGYGMIQISEEINKIIEELYLNILKGYWDKERKYIDDNYESIPFPFEEIETPDFTSKMDWDLSHLIGYLKTWSAVKHYENSTGFNPVDKIVAKLKSQWKPEEIKNVSFPILLRIARIQ